MLIDFNKYKLHDFHHHSIYSDGLNKPIEVVENAAANGLDAFGITDHFNFTNYNWSLTGGQNITNYIKEYSILKERYKNVIALFIGVELNPFHINNFSKINLDIINQLDYVLIEDTNNAINPLDKRFESFLSQLNCSIGLAHTNIIEYVNEKRFGADFFTSFNGHSIQEFIELTEKNSYAREVLDLLGRYNIKLDLNCKNEQSLSLVESLNFYYKNNFPAINGFIEIFNRHKIKTIVGSDCHSIDYYPLQKIKEINQLSQFINSNSRIIETQKTQVDLNQLSKVEEQTFQDIKNIKTTNKYLHINNFYSCFLDNECVDVRLKEINIKDQKLVFEKDYNPDILFSINIENTESENSINIFDPRIRFYKYNYEKKENKQKFIVDYIVRTSFDNSNEDLIAECPKVIVEEYDVYNPYSIKCFDNSTNELICKGYVHSNRVFMGTRQWFTWWRVEIWDYEEKNLLYQDLFNPTGKIISIIFDLDELGGTLAWIPYVEEFRKQHQCTVICSTKWNNLFEKEYPEIIFVPHYTKITNAYAQYCIGVAWDGNPVVMPNDWKKQPFQKLASDILGLEFKEIKPKVSIPNTPRKIKEKYVCISEFGSGRDKMWIYPNGWQTVVDFINQNGYKVVVISKEISTLSNVIDQSGNRPIEERIECLKDAEFFIGVASGLAWLAWSIGTHTVMISDYTPAWYEFQSNITRLYNKSFPKNELGELKIETNPISLDDVLNDISKLINLL